MGAIRDAIAETIGEDLVGLYVYGSLATGAFEPHISDVDLIAILASVPDERLLARLRPQHERLVVEHPDWSDRIEVDYVSVRGLDQCLTHSTTIARISPGEPLHLLEAGRDFLLDWYPAREGAVTLIGPPIDTLIPEIPEADYLEEVRSYLAGLPNRFDGDASAGSRSYAVLTMCRGWYALRTGERLDKRQAAARARSEFPSWAPVIDRATAWRDAPTDDDDDAVPMVKEARAFLAEVARLLELDYTE